MALWNADTVYNLLIFVLLDEMVVRHNCEAPKGCVVWLGLSDLPAGPSRTNQMRSVLASMLGL